MSVAAPAFAGSPLTYTNDFRRTSVSHDYCDVFCDTGSGECDGESWSSTPEAPFADYQESLGGAWQRFGVAFNGMASQSSVMLADRVIASGSVSNEMGALPIGCDLVSTSSRSNVEWRMELPTKSIVEIDVRRVSIQGRAEIVFTGASFETTVAIRETFNVDSNSELVGVFPFPGGLSTWAITGRVFNFWEPFSTHEASYEASVIVHGPSCNPADLDLPVGVLDLSDLQAFVQFFVAGSEFADLAEPIGTLDLADLQEFVTSFVAGCP